MPVCERCHQSFDLGFPVEWARSPAYRCKKCRLHEDCDRRLDATTAELQAKFQDVRSKQTFLTLPFEREPTDNSWKGDLVIVVQGNTKELVYAHKFILSSTSPVFSKMFAVKMLEDETGKVQINDATLPVIRAVVKFCYTAEINFSDELPAEDILEAAHKYDITLLRKICENHLITTLSEENLPKRLKLSHKLEATDLEVAASKYFKSNFDSVIGNVLDELC